MSVVWAFVPAIPTLLDGGLLGSPYTDLYPSVWSVWAPWAAHTDIPTTDLLNYPNGSGWYPNSVIKSLLAGPLLMFLPVGWVYNTLLLASRFATPLCSYFAGRAWGLKHAGAMVFAAGFGCTPMLHGFAIEGISEGTDAWTLALWAWAAGRQKPVAMALFLAVTTLSNWYFGAVCCLLTVIGGFYDRKILLSFAGLGLVLPFVLTFGSAFPTESIIPADVRYEMGFSWGIEKPNWMTPPNPFAKSNYIGWVLAGSALLSRKKWLLWSLVPFVLSTGWPWLYEIPIVERIRFPYRWHLATVAFISLAAGFYADRKNWTWLGWIIALEGILLSGVDVMFPHSSMQVPVIYQKIDLPVLDIPGPVAFSPGETNPSRPRAKYFLYAQTQHQQPIPWALDFNGLTTVDSDWATPWLGWDPVAKMPRVAITNDDIAYLQEIKVGYILIHVEELGQNRSKKLQNTLLTLGLSKQFCDTKHCLFQVPQ